MTSNISLPQLEAATRNALKTWHKPNTGSSPFTNLQIFQTLQIKEDFNARQAANKILYDALETLAADQKEYAQLLHRHFLDGEKMQIIARSLNVGEATVYRDQKRAIEQLTLILRNKEISARTANQIRLEQRMERPTYIELIGVDDHVAHLTKIITSPEPPWLVALEGMGGAGKTSLADALSRHIIGQWLFDDFGWVSARQYHFNPTGLINQVDAPALTAEDLVDRLMTQLTSEVPGAAKLGPQEALAALRARLKQRPHLIVIDNLETVTDLETLLPTLRDLSNPTKFVLTSREGLHHELGIYHFTVPKLSRENALRLIQYEAQLHNSPHLKTAGDDILEKIYKTVGGNPLAIRLVVGQTHIFTPDAILNDLAAAQGQRVETLYTYIYRQAWDRLDELSRRVLLAMPLVAEGEGTLAHLGEVSAVDAASLRDALNWLVTLNLVDRNIHQQEQYYSIHNLTRTFLHQMVLKWS